MACPTPEVPHIYFRDWSVTQTDRSGLVNGGAKKKNNNRSFELKALQAAFPHQVNKPKQLRRRTIFSHAIKKLHHCPQWGRRELFLHMINILVLLCSLCRPTLRKDPSSVRSAKLYSEPPSLCSVTYSSITVSARWHGGVWTYFEPFRVFSISA